MLEREELWFPTIPIRFHSSNEGDYPTNWNVKSLFEREKILSNNIKPAPAAIGELAWQKISPTCLAAYEQQYTMINSTHFSELIPWAAFFPGNQATKQTQENYGVLRR